MAAMKMVGCRASVEALAAVKMDLCEEVRRWIEHCVEGLVRSVGLWIRMGVLSLRLNGEVDRCGA